jgi:hypothetical protein
MPRNTAVRIGNAGTQAMVRSAQANLNRSTSNHRKRPHKSTKRRGAYLPEPKSLRIQQRFVAGQGKSEIAGEEQVDRGTVARIVRFPEVQNFIAQAQKEFFGLIPDALAAVRHALKVEKNAMIGLTVLERTGVSAHRGERMQIPETTDGYSRQAIMIADVLLEGHQQMGVPLGPEIEKVLADSTNCEQQRPKSGRYGPSRMPAADQHSTAITIQTRRRVPLMRNKLRLSDSAPRCYSRHPRFFRWQPRVGFWTFSILRPSRIARPHSASPLLTVHNSLACVLIAASRTRLWQR